MLRRRFALSVVLLLAMLATGSMLAARESTRLDADVMKAALRTTTIEEDGFIDMVVDRVEQGTLPEDLVVSTFQWARKKPRHKFQYFKRGLIVRAWRRGIRLA